MGNGTVIPVYVRNLHKCNADSVKEEAEHLIKMVSHQLIAMAACGDCRLPTEIPWYEHVAREVPQLLEEYAEESFKLTMALRLLDDPDECQDDYDKEMT